jgi:hypothetical protein
MVGHLLQGGRDQLLVEIIGMNDSGNGVELGEQHNTDPLMIKLLKRT